MSTWWCSEEHLSEEHDASETQSPKDTILPPLSHKSVNTHGRISSVWARMGVLGSVSQMWTILIPVRRQSDSYFLLAFIIILWVFSAVLTFNRAGQKSKQQISEKQSTNQPKWNLAEWSCGNIIMTGFAFRKTRLVSLMEIDLKVWKGFEALSLSVNS